MKRLWLVLFSMMLLACSDPKLQPLAGNATIVAFGDSLTSGVGASRESAYPAVLANLTGLEVINAGISGETSGEAVQRLPKVLAQHQPQLLILLTGGNDILRGHSYTSIESNIEQMIAMAKAQNTQVLLIAVPEKKLFSNAAPFYEVIADEQQVAFIDDIIGELQRSTQYKSDAVHFNAQGYAKLAERIYDTLKDEGAL